MDSAAGTIERTYDLLDRLIEETTPEGTVTYTYDGADRRATMTVAGQPQVTYSYDNANRLTGVTQATAAVTIAYDAVDRRTSLTLPNGIVVEYGYDDDSRLTGLTYTQGMSTLGTLTYAYDAAGQRTSVGGTYARTGLPAALASATYDDANQVATFGGTPFTYDANGNVTSDGVRSYTWNARNQLASLTGPVNGSFAYDGVGRRRSKTIGGTTTQFLYDGLNPVQELAGGTPSANLLTGVAIDEFFTRTDAAGVRNYLTDALGSSVALADGAGTIQTEYTYQPFGGTITSGTATANSFSFTGREADGTGRHYYRARYYDASVQRFIGEDPIGFLGGDVSLYSYVSNSPQNFTDPEGLCIPIGPVAVSCIPAAAVAAADLAAYAAATLVALEVAQTISDRMSEHYAQHGKNKNTDSRWEGKTPEQLKEMYKNERNPAERKKLQKHLKDIDEKWSRHSNSRKSNRGGRGSGGGDGSGGGGSGGGKGSSGGGAGGSGSAAAAMGGEENDARWRLTADLNTQERIAGDRRRRRHRQSVQSLCVQLADESWEVRIQAASQLGNVLQGPPPRKLLDTVGKDPEIVVRIEAIQALGKIGSKRALPALEGALSDRSPSVRSYAAATVGALGKTRHIAILAARLEVERVANARMGLLTGIYLLAERSVLPALLRLLESKDYRVRCSTARTLAAAIAAPANSQAILAALRRSLRNESTVTGRAVLRASIREIQSLRRWELQGRRRVRSARDRQADQF